MDSAVREIIAKWMLEDAEFNRERKRKHHESLRRISERPVVKAACLFVDDEDARTMLNEARGFNVFLLKTMSFPYGLGIFGAVFTTDILVNVLTIADHTFENLDGGSVRFPEGSLVYDVTEEIFKQPLGWFERVAGLISK